MKVFSLLLLGICICLANSEMLTEKFAWRELKFAWPSDEVKQTTYRKGYIQGNNLPLNFDVWRDKIFLTVPR